MKMMTSSKSFWSKVMKIWTGSIATWLTSRSILRTGEILGSIFRTIHTIKGTTGFLGFGKLEAVAHVGENLLTKLRDGQLSLHPELTTGLLALVDAVRQMLSSIEALGNEGSATIRI